MAYKPEYPVLNSDKKEDSLEQWTRRQEDRIENAINNVSLSSEITELQLLEGATGSLVLSSYGKVRTLNGRVGNVPRGKTIAVIPFSDRANHNIDVMAVSPERLNDTVRIASWGDVIAYASGTVYINVSWIVE